MFSPVNRNGRSLEAHVAFSAACKTRSLLWHCSLPVSANSCKCPDCRSPALLLWSDPGLSMEKPIFQVRLQRIHMYSGIFSQAWNSNIRSDGYNTSLQSESCTRQEMLLVVSYSAAITLQFYRTVHKHLKAGSQWVSGTVDVEHEQGHRMPH